MELPNGHFDDFSIEFKKINPEDFDGFEVDKAEISPNDKNNHERQKQANNCKITGVFLGL